MDQHVSASAYTVSFDAPDEKNPSNSLTFDFKVLTNHPPVLVTPLADEIIIYENQRVDYSFPVSTFNEPDGETMLFTASTTPTSTISAVKIDSTSWKLTSDPLIDLGTYEVVLKASTAPGAPTATTSTTVKVLTNNPPVLLYPENKSVIVGHQLTYKLPVDFFSDPEDEILTITVTLSDDSALPSFLTYDDA